MQCQATTKRGARCTLMDATPHEGQWLCANHHPHGLYRQQVRARNEARGAHFKKIQPAHQHATKADDYKEQLAALRTAKGLETPK